MKNPWLIVSLALNFVLGLLLFGAQHDINFLQSTIPACTCRAELIQCKKMNENATRLLRGEVLSIKVMGD